MSRREGLTGLVRTAMELKKLSDAMDVAGYRNTPYQELFYSLADAIYTLLNEHTSMFDESKTYEALYAKDMTVEQRVDILLG